MVNKGIRLTLFAVLGGDRKNLLYLQRLYSPINGCVVIDEEID